MNRENLSDINKSIISSTIALIMRERHAAFSVAFLQFQFGSLCNVYYSQILYYDYTTNENDQLLHSEAIP